MTDLKSQVQITLQEARYKTWLSVMEDLDVVGFEDESVMGFACIFDAVPTLLTRWQDLETRLLAKHAPALKKAGEKTWNIYSVFLSAAVPNETQLREIRAIEENQERTRKLAASGLTNQQALITALLPLLPLQNQPTLDREDFDVTARLTRRIAAIAPSVAKAALDPTITVSEVVRLMGVE